MYSFQSFDKIYKSVQCKGSVLGTPCKELKPFFDGRA